jgi:hypothetical protein
VQWGGRRKRERKREREIERERELEKEREREKSIKRYRERHISIGFKVCDVTGQFEAAVHLTCT